MNTIIFQKMSIVWIGAKSMWKFVFFLQQQVKFSLYQKKYVELRILKAKEEVLFTQ